MSESISDYRQAGLRPMLAAAVAGGALLTAALALWIHYGTAVFFETIAAGIGGCF